MGELIQKANPERLALKMAMDEDSTTLDIRVIPNARKNEVGGSRAGRLLVRTTASPVDDKANIAVSKLLADHLGVRRRNITIVTGHHTRDKTIHIQR